MFFYRDSDAGLCTGNLFFSSYFSRARITEITFHFHSQPLQRSLADAAGGHSHIGDNGFHLSVSNLSVQRRYGMVVGPQQVFHFEIGRGMDGVQQGPFVVQGDILVLQLAFDSTETAYHDVLSDGSSRFLVFPIVSPGSNKAAFPFVRL